MVRLTRRAEKDLAGLPAGLRTKAEDLISRLDSEPALGHKLLGELKGLRSARLGRSYRVLYTTTSSETVVLTVQPRKDVYR
jgi:mRNA-degrading endonuclease RelE of RelBE toxin-antitoxin system